jgi:hypothetical protein
MTVRAIVPDIEYTGNGVIVKYYWDWDMIDDSSINVMVDNERVTNWSLEGQSVVFSTAPADGAFIQIYRRTIIWMPEDYVAFGRFLADKTELSLDRATLIAQERMGDAINNEPPNGIVGGSDLSISRQEFSVTVISERGTDAVIPLYDPDGVDPTPPPDPDPTILWGGDALLFGIYSLAGNTNGVAATIRFRLDLISGDPTHASAYYPNYNAFAFASWLDADPADDEYWMRVRLPNPAIIVPNLIVNDGTFERQLGVPFQIRGTVISPIDSLVDRAGEIIVDRAGNSILPRGAIPTTNTNGPYISVHTFGDTPPITRFAQVYIDICKDDGTGLPDGGWATRLVILEAIFNA